MCNLALILQDGPDPAAIQHMVTGMLGLLFAIVLVAIVLVVLPFWFICRKAGFSPWLALLNILPFGNLILIYVLAFADWKVIPAPQAYWQPHYPPQPPYPPQS